MPKNIELHVIKYLYTIELAGLQTYHCLYFHSGRLEDFLLSIAGPGSEPGDQSQVL